MSTLIDTRDIAQPSSLLAPLPPNFIERKLGEITCHTRLEPTGARERPCDQTIRLHEDSVVITTRAIVLRRPSRLATPTASSAHRPLTHLIGQEISARWQQMVRN